MDIELIWVESLKKILQKIGNQFHHAIPKAIIIRKTNRGKHLCWKPLAHRCDRSEKLEATWPQQKKKERDLKLGQCRWCLVYTCKKETAKTRRSDKDLGKETQEHHESTSCFFASRGLHVPNSINMLNLTWGSIFLIPHLSTETKDRTPPEK